MKKRRDLDKIREKIQANKEMKIKHNDHKVTK